MDVTKIKFKFNRMRDLLMTLFLLGTLFYTLTAYSANNNNSNNGTYEVIKAQKSLLIQNNIDYKFHNDPHATIIFFLDDNKIQFNAYQKYEVDGKIFILGKGNHNVNIICIDGNNVCIPVGNRSKIIVDNKRYSNYILRLIDDIPEYNGKFIGI